MPYGTFTYVVQYDKIVQPTALWVTNNVGYDRLVLSACNPLYSAAQRIIVFARLKTVVDRCGAQGHLTARASFRFWMPSRGILAELGTHPMQRVGRATHAAL